MITGAVCGALVALGAMLVWRGLVPARPSLAFVMARTRRVEVPDAQGGRTASGWERVVRQGATLTARLGGGSDGLRRDLRVLGRSLERHWAEKALLALGALALPPATVAVLELGGVSVPWSLPAWLSAVLGAVGFVLPDVVARQEAAGRRRDMRHALSSYLDLVEVSQAGGMGVESALTRAAEVGHGPLFVELRRALGNAARAGRTPWAGLERLGADLGVDELSQLAATVSLAGELGASLRESLAAKSRSLRDRLLADAEAAAKSRSVQMALPLVMLGAGITAFMLFPGLYRVLTIL